MGNPDLENELWRKLLWTCPVCQAVQHPVNVEHPHSERKTMGQTPGVRVPISGANTIRVCSKDCASFVFVSEFVAWRLGGSKGNPPGSD
jgi:hypothetical protein